jgi:hypothetical protein
MANSLTGDYEAVLEIAIRQINGVLGTLHQNGATQDAALQTPHSITARILDQRPPPADGGAFEVWAIEFQRESPGRGLRDIQTQLTATAPPGAARMLIDAFAALREDWGNVFPPPPPGTVRGLVELQVASATITVPEGSSSEITVNAGIRAAYYPDTGTTDLPAPIHGDVQAAFEVRTLLTSVGTRLFITPSSQDAAIQFHAAPGSGLSAGDESTLAVQVRNFLRQGMTFLPIDLPSGFPFSAFKGLGSGQVIALPFQLSGAAAPPSGVQPLTQSFIDSSGFAVAVSKEYVTGLIPMDRIRAAINGAPPFKISGVTIHLSVTSLPTPLFQSGGIEISGEVAALAGNVQVGFISFKQLVTLFFTSPQTVSLVRRGDPIVDQSWFISHDSAVSIVRTQFDNSGNLGQRHVSLSSGACNTCMRLEEKPPSSSPSMVATTGMRSRKFAGAWGCHSPWYRIRDSG